jgi:polygalacturonase
VTSLDKYATPNSNEVQTSEIQKAIDVVASQGGTLYVPPGKYRSGMIQMKSNVQLWLADGAVIQGTADTNDYPYEPNTTKIARSQILFHNVKNASISGRGIIDGNGVEYVAKHGSHGRPHLCVTYGSSDIHIEHAIIFNSGSFNVHIIGSHNVVVNEITIISNRERLFEGDVNTDGIDVVNSHDVHVINPFIYNGDDGVCIKADDSSNPSETRDVLLSGGVILSHADATKIGTCSHKGMAENIIFRDVQILYSHRAMGLISRGGCTYRNVTWKNIEIYTPIQMLDVWMDKEAGNFDGITFDDVRTLNYFPPDSHKPSKPNFNGVDANNGIKNVLFKKFSVNGHIWKDKNDAEKYGSVTFGEFVSNVNFEP